jgi:hypothetical protein
MGMEARMTDTTLSELILRELAGLPEARQADVLAFVRFLKIGLADADTVAAQFDRALVEARRIAEARGITDEDIENEINAYRTHP